MSIPRKISAVEMVKKLKRRSLLCEDGLCVSVSYGIIKCIQVCFIRLDELKSRIDV